MVVLATETMRSGGVNWRLGVLKYSCVRMRTVLPFHPVPRVIPKRLCWPTRERPHPDSRMACAVTNSGAMSVAFFAAAYMLRANCIWVGVGIGNQDFLMYWPLSLKSFRRLMNDVGSMG